MFISKRILRVSALLLVFSMSICSINAATPKKKKTSKKRPRTQVASKSTKTGTSTNREKSTIAKYDKQNKQSNLPSNVEILLADAATDVSVSMEIMKQRMFEQKEMQELSTVLGVSISDPSLLNLYREAADWLGTRYRRGGMSRQAVDCSGFTNIIYKNVFGVQLDRVSTTIAHNVNESVSKDDLEPGDLVFFSTFKKKYINHVGVYLGDGKFIHASIKRGVIVSSLSEGYYSTAWRKGGRI